MMLITPIRGLERGEGGLLVLEDVREMMIGVDCSKWWYRT